MATVKEAQVNHSPLPWARFDADSLEIAGSDGHEICDVFQCGGIREIDEADANTALIIRAVNNHDALVAALEALEPYLTDEAAMLDYASLNEGRASGFDVASVKARRALSNVRAAAQETK